MISILNQEEKQDVHLVGNSSSSIHMTSAAEVAVTNVILEAVAGSTGDHAVTAATLLSVVAVGAATLPAAVADLLVSAATASTTTTTNDDSNKNKEDTILLVPPIIDKLSKEQEVEETKAVGDKSAIAAALPPLEELILKCPVLLVKGNAENVENIDLSIQSLDNLICEISKLDYNSANHGISTGFASSSCQRLWLDLPNFPQYQTLPDVNLWSQGGDKQIIPLPSPLVALQYLLAIKETWNQRKAWAMAATLDDKKKFCSCIGAWEHSKTDILHLLANQTLEALMVAEADQCLRNTFTSHKLLREWDQLYSPDSCPKPADMEQSYMDQTPLRLLDTRDEYITAYLERLMAAESTIDICLCYIFARDPFVRYLLLDVLPFIVQQKRVRVRILIEQMVLEGESIKMFFQRLQNVVGEKSQLDSAAIKTSKDANWLNSFRWKLPPNCPPFVKAEKAIYSSVGLIREVMKESSKCPHNPVHIKYWFVRDKKSKYRIKSHVKCHVFDGNDGARGMVIAGGSNFAPRCGSTDCDFLIGGGIAKVYQELFDKMFDSMALHPLNNCTILDDSSSVTTSSSTASTSNHSCLVGVTEVQQGTIFDDESLDYSSMAVSEWTDPSCKVSFLHSVPSSDGEDSILRCILGAIKTAGKSITMCMGHSNVPAVMREALAEASYRGVKVSLLMNSFYSCDLRNGQRDLFGSLMKLLEVAPGIELWVVTMPSRRSDYQAIDSVAWNEAPAFLHSKYVVVDSKWSAVGSWNLWTRAAFYEIEAEIFVHSAVVAASLEEKFDRERRQFAARLQKPEDCIHYHPTGCSICHQFGPFFVEQDK